MTSAETISGGCQCGAVRYRIAGPLTNAHICHCRMCQKAAGNYFLPLANVQRGDFSVTRGAVSWFQSSAHARRGFCKDCGTPLIYDGYASPHLNVTLGSLDKPADVKPGRQYGLESKIAWFADLARLPAITTADAYLTEELDRIERTRRVHPDHDTDDWPVGGED